MVNLCSTITIRGLFLVSRTDDDFRPLLPKAWARVAGIHGDVLNVQMEAC